MSGHEERRRARQRYALGSERRAGWQTGSLHRVNVEAVGEGTLALVDGLVLAAGYEQREVEYAVVMEKTWTGREDLLRSTRFEHQWTVEVRELGTGQLVLAYMPRNGEPIDIRGKR